MKRLPWVGGLSPAKKAPSVGFVYFCVPHETQAPGSNDRAAREAGTRTPRGRLDRTLSASQAKLCLSVYNFSISTVLLFFSSFCSHCCFSSFSVFFLLCSHTYISFQVYFYFKVLLNCNSHQLQRHTFHFMNYFELLFNVLFNEILVALISITFTKSQRTFFLQHFLYAPTGSK